MSQLTGRYTRTSIGLMLLHVACVFLFALYVTLYPERIYKRPSEVVLQPVHVDEDETVLRGMFRAYYEEGTCTRDTPIRTLVFFGAGFGNLISWWAFSFIEEVSRYVYHEPNRVLVFVRHDQQPWKAFQGAADFMRPSYCQQMFDENPRQFTNVHSQFIHEGQPTPGSSIERLPMFLHRSTAWYLRRVIGYWYLPRVDLDALRALGLPVVLVKTPAYPGRYSIDDIRVDLPPYVAVHVRRGDACTTRRPGSNLGRPNCQDVSVYVNAVSTAIDMAQPRRLESVYVSTDTEAVIQEFKEFGMHVRVLSMSRAKYLPKGEQKIEVSMDNEADQRAAVTEFIADLLLLSHATILIGQGYSTLWNMAFFSGPPKGYHTIDDAYPCFRGGCPGPFSGVNTYWDCGAWMQDVFKAVRHPETLEPYYRTIWEDAKVNDNLCYFKSRHAAEFPAYCLDPVEGCL